MSLTDYYTKAAIPKPEPRKKTRARKKRLDVKNLKAFRDAVWAREQILAFAATGSMIARCERCRCQVWRESEPFGHVHHKIGRRNKATRYDPKNGILLCPGCHRRAHKQ